MTGIQKAMLTNIQQMIIVVPKFNMTYMNSIKDQSTDNKITYPVRLD